LVVYRNAVPVPYTSLVDNAVALLQLPISAVDVKMITNIEAIYPEKTVTIPWQTSLARGKMRINADYWVSRPES